jgi:hypothetical protein
MCFSASASFASGVVLAAAGGMATTFAVRRRDWRFVPFTLVPLVFGAQQLAEGFVWLGLHDNRPALVRPAALIFLFFAFGWWPVWMPLAVGLTSRGWVRNVALGCLVVGGLLAGFLAGEVLTNPDDLIDVRAIHHHIRYDLGAAPIVRHLSSNPVEFIYLLTVAAPLLARRDRRVRVFGVLLAASALLTKALANYAFISLWCFFAAIIAVYLA